LSGPPPELKQWSKRALIREVERLRAVLHEHSARSHGSAPERAGGIVADPDPDPHGRGNVLLDARGAVLLDAVDVVLVDTNPGGQSPPSVMLSLAGRINYDTQRSSVAYLMPTDGAAGIATGP
jgi:hypothetical protein